MITEAELFAAVEQARDLEATLLQTQIERLTAVIKEHGLPVPGEDARLGASGLEHLAACQLVVTKAYELFDALEALKLIVGSGMELLRTESWRVPDAS
jgi:hypothetical protein